jgi:drug/metabolite transporter (DMT)-like permease
MELVNGLPTSCWGYFLAANPVTFLYKAYFTENSEEPNSVHTRGRFVSVKGQMKCIVTAGPTYEELDEVRRMTNFSTGALGSELANYLVDQGRAVELLRVKGSPIRKLVLSENKLEARLHFPFVSKRRMADCAAVQSKPHNGALAGSLLLAVFLFGANNTGIKFLVGFWPPLAIGATRFLLAGLVLMALLRWTGLFAVAHPLSPDLNRRLWRGSGLHMALYIVAFNFALKLTSIGHVALYLGAAPVWALLWEGQPEKHWKSAQRYGAAALAFSGVFILFWPILRHGGSTKLPGEILALAASVLWTSVGRQSRLLGRELSGAEIAAHTFWRAGLLITPLALIEVSMVHIPWRADLAWTQVFCILGGGVAAFALWNNALRHWPTSQVYLFNNLVPISTMTWAHFCLNEPFTGTFWTAMLLIGSGVLIGQANLQKIFGALWIPSD